MNKFNLTFSGEIMTGKRPKEVKRRFAKLFGIDDQERIERFFSGEEIILRRNLERKDAAQWFQEMRDLGVVAQLVKVSPEELAWENTARDHAARKLASEKSQASTAPDEQRAKESQPLEQARQSAEKTSDAAAQLAEAQRQQAAERQRAEKERREQQRKEEDARKAQEHAAKKQAEAARRKAEKQAEKRNAAEEKERAKAKKAAEKAAKAKRAREKAEEKARQREVEKAHREAQRKAEREAAQKARDEALAKARKEAEEKAAAKKLDDEKRALEQAERDEALRIQREAAERKAAEGTEQRRQQQQKLEREAAERRQREEQKAQAQRAQQEREAAAARAEQERIKAEQAALEAVRQRQAAEEAARLQVLAEIEQRRRQEEEAKEQAALEEQAIERGAAELARGGALKSAPPLVKTKLEVPQRILGSSDRRTQLPPRKRKIGEPNFYTLEAFRVTQALRERASTAQRAVRKGIMLAGVGLLLTIASFSSLHQLGNSQPITHISAVTADDSGNLLLFAGEQILIHDRAGVPVEQVTLQSMGLKSIAAPLHPSSVGHFLALGLMTNAAYAEPTLLRCHIEQRKCQSALQLPAGLSATSFQENPLIGDLFIADSNTSQLIRLSSSGEILGQREIPLPASPILHLHSGLLFINSVQPSSISVFRYDANAFGEQLDEVLLMPEEATAAGFDRIGQFLHHTQNWWVVLYRSSDGRAGLFRFDQNWAHLGQVPINNAEHPLQLIPWGNKLLVNTQHSLQLERINSAGAVEAPFRSSLLQDLAEAAGQRQQLARLAVISGLLLGLCLLLWGLWVVYINRLRALVYRSQHVRGAEPVDDLADDFHWIAPVSARITALRQRSIAWCMLAGAACLVAVGVGAKTQILLALMVALCGPLIGLWLVTRQPIGHIGILNDKLMLVDHAEHYHLGIGPEIQYRGAFLLLNDVVVFCGNSFLPAFTTTEINRDVAPIARGAIKIDRKTLLVKVLQSKPPVVQATLAILACLGAALLILLVPLFA